MHEIADETGWFDLRTILVDFLKRQGLGGQVKIEEILGKILTNKHLLSNGYGIDVREVSGQREGRVLSFPVF